MGRIYVYAGTVEVNANLTTNYYPNLYSGTLGGTGTLAWNQAYPAYANGAINPGTSASTGILSTDEIAFQSNGSLSVQLNGTTAGAQHDRLNVTGSVALAGNLNVSLGTGYTPAIGDQFVILTNDSNDPISGTFNGLSEGGLFAVSGNYFQITYTGGDGNDVVLTNILAGVWDGGGVDANWSTAANWVGDTLPLAGSNLIFPNAAAQKSNTNNFGAGTIFNGILIQGSGYALSGNLIVLNGSVTSNGTGNTFGLPVQLGTNGGFANTIGSTFTVSGTIDTNSKVLNLNSVSGTTVVSGQITGSGSLSTGGSGVVALEGSNSYSGTTQITSGTLAVRNSQALGVANGSAASGTSVTGAGATIRLENNVSVGNERLSSPSGVNFNFAGSGSGSTNSWSGEIASGTYFYLYPGSGSILQLNGSVSSSGSDLYFNDSGKTVINGSFTNVGRIYGYAGTVEVNANLTTNYYPYLSAARLVGRGRWHGTKRILLMPMGRSIQDECFYRNLEHGRNCISVQRKP